MTIYDSLQGINAYPVPDRTLVTIATKRGLEPETVVTATILNSDAYMLAHADVLFWLSMAPNVTQGGQSYSFTYEQREEMRGQAMDTYKDLDPDNAPKTRYGYKGDTL